MVTSSLVTLLYLKVLVALLLHKIHRLIDYRLPYPIISIVLVHQTFQVLLLCLLMSDLLRSDHSTLLFLYNGVVKVIIELRRAHRRVIIHVRLEICRVLFFSHLRVLYGLSVDSRGMLWLVTAIAIILWVHNLLNPSLPNGYLFYAIVTICDFLPSEREDLWLELGLRSTVISARTKGHRGLLVAADTLVL